MRQTSSEVDGPPLRNIDKRLPAGQESRVFFFLLAFDATVLSMLLCLVRSKCSFDLRDNKLATGRFIFCFRGR